MPSFTMAEVYQEARQVYLVDTLTGEIFTDDVLNPFGIRAVDELNLKLGRVGHQVAERTEVSIPILAGIKELIPPAELLEPISLEERDAGSSNEDEWREMTRERMMPSASPSQTLGAWDWSFNLFKFRGALTDREVKIRYLRMAITGGLNPTTQVNLFCKSFLSARVAALAAGHIGGNAEKAAYIQKDADDSIDDLIGISVNSEQSTPVRRRPFRR